MSVTRFPSTSKTETTERNRARHVGRLSYPRSMGRIFGQFIGMLLLVAVPLAAPAQASPEDPYGDDYVAIAINPITGESAYGMSGTQEHAIEITMTMCQAKGPCLVAQAMHHGCVGIAFDPVSRVWASGRGVDELSAATEASVKLPDPVSDQARSGGYCSS